MIALAVHYSQPPEWRWYILAYFFLAGLAGGCYTLGAMLRFWGSDRDEQAARLCFLLALPLVILCPIFLTIDLGQPSRFWHMLVDVGVAGPGLNFKYWSPMSMGVWGLLGFGLFAAIAFLETVALDGRYRYPGAGLVTAALRGTTGKVVHAVGTVFALFVAGYTGVLLSVSNQPVWSDTYALGGLFLASGISGSAALVALSTAWRPAAAASEAGLVEAEGYWGLIELAFIVVTLVTLAFAGQLATALAMPWSLLWVIALASLVVPLAGRFAPRWTIGTGGTAVLAQARLTTSTAGAIIVLLGVLALRAAVIWSAQG